MSLNLFSGGISHGPSTTAYWDGQSIMSGTTIGAAADDRQTQWSKCTFVLTRTTPATIVDDVGLFSFNFVAETLSFGSSVLTSGQKAAIEARADTWWGVVSGSIPSHWKLLEYRWHDYQTNWLRPGPAVRITAKNVAAGGAAGNVVPDQVATSVTLKTNSRKHWGRAYLPQLITTAYDSTGRILAGNCDTIATATRTFLNGASTDGTPPVVPSQLYGAVLGVTAIQVDSTPDVIRSRRAKHPSYRKEYTS